jgi:hypothetical protein
MPTVYGKLNLANHAKIMREKTMKKVTYAEILKLKDQSGGQDLSNTDLQGLRSTLAHTNLRNSNFRNAKVTYANLTCSDMSGADLRGADFSETDLSNVKLIGADLRGCNLTNANLRNAKLTHANLTGVDLSSADLRGATMPVQTELARGTQKMAETSPSINTHRTSATPRTQSFKTIKVICPQCGKNSELTLSGECKGACTYDLDLFESGGGLICVICGAGFHGDIRGKGKGVLHCKFKSLTGGSYSSGYNFSECRAPIPATPDFVTLPKASEKKKGWWW